MANFGDQQIAAKLRDYIRRVAEERVNTLRPRHTYGTVQTIDRTNRKCTVLLPGEVSATPVLMGSLQPKTIGQRVRIEGVPGDRYITDVIGSAWVDGAHGYPPEFGAFYDSDLGAEVIASYTNSIRCDAGGNSNLRDFNVARPTGHYTINAPTGNAPGGDTIGWWHLQHWQHGVHPGTTPAGWFSYQIAANLFAGNADHAWVRRCENSVWSDWSPVSAQSAKIDGTLKPASDGAATYPVGVSWMFGNAAGWPATWVHVMTRRLGNDVVQFVYDTQVPNTPRMWVRTHDSNGSWSAFKPFAEQFHAIGAAGEPGFVNGWENFGGGLVTAGFWRQGDTVYMEGVIRHPSGGSNGIGSVAFNLQPPYRPRGTHTIASTAWNGQAQIDAQLRVAADGNVTPFMGASNHFSINGFWRAA